MAKKRKRYRYIFCGVVNPEDKLSNFRLIAAGSAMAWLPFATCIRVEIPENVELWKYPTDSYSTSPTDISIKDLNPIVYNRCLHCEDPKLTEMWLEGKIQPYEFYLYMK